MPSAQNKITIRQFLILFVLVTLSPAIRLFPQICAELGGISGWTAPIISVVGLIILLAVLNAFLKNKELADLSAVFERSLGKIAGKILIALYLVWVIVLFALYIRYYAERLLSSMFPNTNIRFFILLMLAIVYYASRGRIESIARFGEFTFIMFTVVLLVFYLFLIPTVKLSNLLPLTYYDIWPATKATYPILGIWGYITFMFFLGEYLIKKEEFIKQSKQMSWFLVIMTTLFLIVVIGSLGAALTERMPLPFFAATKLIGFMQAFNRLEAVLLSIWVVSDFIIITVYAMIIMNIIKKLFNVSETKYFASPLMMIGYVGSLFLATSRFELEPFSSKLALPVNLFLCFIVPIIVLGVGRLRKKI